MAKKAVAPVVTVKPVADAGGVRVGWWVRCDGEVLHKYPGDDAGKRAALRHRDSLLAEWKAAQRVAVRVPT